LTFDCLNALSRPPDTKPRAHTLDRGSQRLHHGCTAAGPGPFTTIFIVKPSQEAERYRNNHASLLLSPPSTYENGTQRLLIHMFEGGFTSPSTLRLKSLRNQSPIPGKELHPPALTNSMADRAKIVTFFGIQNPTSNGSKSYKLIDHYVVGSVGYN
jgi:hypothetical protein